MASVGDEARETSVAEAPLAGGEMSALIRAHDWAVTPLGPLENWPPSLRTAVSICLASRFPMLLWWGPDLVMLYNDAYRPMLGSTKHPAALGQRGRDCWPEIWDVIGPMLEGVLTRGAATYSDDQLLLLDRNGYVEECYFTFSYSPIRDESGGIGGVFTAVTETTERVLGERRMSTLRELAARTVGAHSAEDAGVLAASVLAGNPADIPFALLYLLDAAVQHAHLAGTSGLEAGTPFSPQQVELTERSGAAAPWPLARVARTGEAARVGNLAARVGARPLHLQPDRLAPDAALVLPVAQAGQDRPAALLVAGLNPRRALDDSYRGFFDLVTGQIGAAIADARANEAERQRAEALAALDRAKTAFFNNVSHEFRTPLTLLLGPLEQALAAPPQTPLRAERDHLESAHRNSLRLLRLVNTLLDFSRIEAGRAAASYEPTDLAALTADLASGFRAAVERAGLRLVVDCPPLPALTAPVYVDHEMWEKIVLNLLSNALKFTFEGAITVTLRAEEERVVLAVRDTGTGIPEEEVPHLFERFHRVRGARARTHEGTGIGLALVRELVTLHGGAIGVQSALGQGTTVTVTLPRGLAHLPPERIAAARTLASTALGAAPYVEEALRWLPDADEPAPARGDGAGGSNGGDGTEGLTGESTAPAATLGVTPTAALADGTARILLADDNADMRAYLRRLLGARYAIEAVANGAAALAAARAHPPDLVLADVMMPELDGFALLRELRADPRTRTLPVILLSARAGEEATAAGLEAGADDYLVKPFAASELLARVQAHLALARVRKEAMETERTLRAEAEAERKRVEELARQMQEQRDRLQAEVTLRMQAEETLRASEERQGFLLRLSDALRPLADPAAIQGAACRLLGEHLGTQRAYYVEIHEAQDVAVVRQDYVSDGLPSLVREYPLAFFRWVVPLYKQGRPVVVADLHTSPLVPEPDREAMEAAQVIAWIAIPLVKRGELVGALCVADAQPREWDDTGVALAEETSERIWAAVERARAETALRVSEDRYRAIAETANEGIWLVDYAARTLFVNARMAALLGTTVDDVLARTVLDFTFEEDRPLAQERIGQNLAGQPEQFDFRFRRADGTAVQVLACTSPLRDADGAISGALGMFSDVSALRDLERAREEFLSSAAHDLKTPLTSIRGQAQLAQRRLARLDSHDAALAPAIEQLARIQEGTDAMLALINDLVDVTRQQMGGVLDLRREPADLVALVWGSVEAQRDASGRPIQLEADVQELYAEVDAARFVRVVGNLLSNALKYSPRDSAITVRLAREDGAAGPEAVLEVRDEGIGIPAADLPSIFDRFQRASNVSSHVQGTGIGLASARQIVEQHGGTIAAESIEGAGSTFTVRLPLA